MDLNLFNVVMTAVTVNISRPSFGTHWLREKAKPVHRCDLCIVNVCFFCCMHDKGKSYPTNLNSIGQFFFYLHSNFSHGLLIDV